MPPEIVLKIGGSLDRSDRLPDLCSAIGMLGKRHSIVVVPGGGKFADLVRQSYRRYDLGESAAHRMALLAMDQYGCLLDRLIENSVLETGLGDACRSAESGLVAILLPSAAVLRDSGLPHSWQVTSDTVSAWVASETGSRKLVLLKDVDGLMPSETASAGIMPEMTVDQLAGHSGGVDPYLSRFLGSAPMETWVINGLLPERITELLDSGFTTGTRIS